MKRTAFFRFMDIQHRRFWLMSQIPTPISNAPIKKTHFGTRHARNIPTPMAINITPPSHLIGAPLHLFRIPTPPLFIPIQQFKKCASKTIHTTKPPSILR